MDHESEHLSSPTKHCEFHSQFDCNALDDQHEELANLWLALLESLDCPRVVATKSWKIVGKLAGIVGLPCSLLCFFLVALHSTAFAAVAQTSVDELCCCEQTEDTVADESKLASSDSAIAPASEHQTDLRCGLLHSAPLPTTLRNSDLDAQPTAVPKLRISGDAEYAVVRKSGRAIVTFIAPKNGPPIR